jgi:hypothetical protein
MNDIQVAAIFGRMPNNNRLDVLAEVMKQTTLPDKLKERVRGFIAGFKICAENRHDLMHSHSGGIFTSTSRNVRGILLTKYSKSGKKLVCTASLADLRKVADEIHGYARWGFWVAGEIRNFSVAREAGNEADFWRMLRDKPPQPTSLLWNVESDVLKPASPP